MNRKILFVVILLVLLSLSCSLTGKDAAQTQTENPEVPVEIQIPTVKPTKTPDPMQATASQNQGEITSGEQVEVEPVEETNSDAPVFFIDEFDGDLNETDWSIETYSGSEDDDPYFEINQRRGMLEFYLDSPYLYLYRFYEAHYYRNIRIDFEVENKGVNSNNIGAVCRLTDDGWYEFITTSGGYYSIMRYDEYGDEELAYGGIKSLSFGADKKNLYTFICMGSHLILAVNDIEIVDVVDEEFLEEGAAGINVSAEEILPVQVQFNWLQFSEP